MEYSKYFNKIANNRFPSGIRLAANIVKRNKENIPFAAGLPNSTIFPLAGINITLKDGKVLSLNQKRVQQALQYSENIGITALRDWFQKLQCIQHSLPEQIFENNCCDQFKEQRNVMITAGSQDGLCKILEMFVTSGDGVLCSDFTYPGFMMSVKPLGGKCVSIKSDENGIRADDLVDVLEIFETEAKPKPKLMYVNPSGANPTGQTMSLIRKKEIYAICQKHDILIIEDDPYYYLQYNKLVGSFLSLDVDGRVLRLDSMSKILSAGLRIGVITGPAELLVKVQMHVACSVIHASSLSQMIVLEILENMGYDGFIEHTKRAAKFYESKKNLVIKAAESLLSGLCEWNQPTCGLYLWITIKNIKDTKKLLEECAPRHNVVLVPGEYFAANGCVSSNARLSYSCVSDENIYEGIKRLANSIKEYLLTENL